VCRVEKDKSDEKQCYRRRQAGCHELMSISLFALLLVLCSLSFGAKKGIIELDEISWDRIVDGSKPVLVVFTEFSWKDPTDYEKVSAEFKDTKVIIAKVDGGSNDELKKRFGVETFPTFKFFPVGHKDTPLSYSGAESAAEVIDFIRVQLNPKLQDLKDMAASFLGKNAAERQAIQKKASDLVDTLQGGDQEYGKFYLASFKKVAEKGEEFLKAEKERLGGLVDNKATTDKKKSEFAKRLNVLHAFSKEL